MMENKRNKYIRHIEYIQNTVSSQAQVTQPREETHSLPESQGLLQRKNEVLMPEVEGMNYKEKEQW